MNGLSQPKFTTGDSNTLLLEFPACSPYIPSVHNPGPKKRLRNASGLGGTNCGSRKLPLRSTSPEPTRKRPRVDLDENSEIHPIPHEVSYTSVTPPKSHVTVIHSTMSASEVVAALGYYGCEDLGPRLDVRSCGEHPEVITGKVPFSERRNDVALAHLIVNRKETPHRPSEHIPSDSKDGDAFWSLIISCWAYKPEERPSAKEARDIV
ncbi:unnamed protein product [Rhizoctonia solani]|uniref:Serine-threonine/tyrosine-protein kinase catalytic domain-containing protein n=1 Tax=Rhizoctonia solani TaxID=456999 RepID=A0A8H3DUH2_9AGAM|nr:unnamed protein product [Rhizoctonia solani]